MKHLKYVYALVFGLLLIYARFSGICHSAYMPLFALFKDPTYYLGDIYVHGSIVSTSSYLYPLLKIFGSLPSNTYFIFFIYIIVSLAHIYFIFKIAETFFPELIKHDVGLVSIMLFLYDYPIFMAHSQLVYQHSFSQTAVVMPVIAASLYYYLKDKIVLSVFLVSILAIPLHFKSAWIVLLIIMAYIVISYKRFTFKQLLLCGSFILAVALIMYFYRSQSVSSNLDFAKRLELCNAINLRDAEEGVVLLNSRAYFLKFFLVFISGLFCIRFIKDQIQRRKLYYFYLFSFLVLFFGAVYSSYLYKFIPIPEIALLGVPRSMAYPIIISILLIGGVLLLLNTKNDKNRWVYYLTGLALFSLAYFPNFEKKSIYIYIACILISYLFIYRDKKITGKMKLRPLTAWFFVAIIMFLLIRDVEMARKSIRSRSPYFPLVIFGFDRDSYDCQLWVKANTNKESVFLAFRDDGEGGLIFDSSFRGYSCRSMLLGDYNSFYFNYDLLQEHYKREKFISLLSKLILGNNLREMKALIEASPWKIDYIVLPRRFKLDYPQVYSSSAYSCFFVAE